MKKVKNQRLSHNIIIEDNIYKYNPWDLAGKPPKGDKTNWLMHEYLVDNSPPSSSVNNMRLNDCILCKIYKKVGKSKQDHFGNDVNLDISQRMNIIPDNRVVEYQNQPVNNVAATCGITYSDMVDPPLGFEDDDATYPLLGFEDDNDMWNMPDLCVDRGYQSTGDLGDILIESANLLKKEKKPSVWRDDNIFSWIYNKAIEVPHQVILHYELCANGGRSGVKTKDIAQELQSILQQRCGVDEKLETRKYLTSRKMVRNAIEKSLANLKAKVVNNGYEGMAALLAF
ncbi:hypothetical protein ACOSQ2_020807 [Xanthoceras sorbifolium]